jgi:hypothetical protein
MRSTGTYRFAAVMIAGSLMLSSTAANAAATISPWAALSAFGTQASRDAACDTAVASAAAAAAAQGASGGCVLPVTDPAPPPPPVVQNIPVPPPPVAAAGGGGFGISPLVLALGALALGGLIYLLVHNNDDEVSPD